MGQSNLGKQAYHFVYDNGWYMECSVYKLYLAMFVILSGDCNFQQKEVKVSYDDKKCHDVSEDPGL